MKISKLKIDKKTQRRIIEVLTVLIGLWLILYFIPEIFVLLFNTILGNLILLLTTILMYSQNRLYGILTGVVFVLLYRFSQLSQYKNKKKENFDVQISGSFEIETEEEKRVREDEERRSILHDLQQNFLNIQSTINRNTIFDMAQIEKQASVEELQYFKENGMWPWSQKVIQLFQDAVNRNPYIRTEANSATNVARTIYNEAAILQMLSYQTKEGEFLLNGVLVRDPSGNPDEELPSGFGAFPYKAGLMEDRTYDIIKCNLNNSENPTLERIRYTGKGGIYGEQTTKVSKVDYTNLENIIPGFSFISEPCNPCSALASTPDYSCAYKLKAKGRAPFISEIWQLLWGINDNPLVSQPSFMSEKFNDSEFPLLSELQSELKKSSNTNINNYNTYNNNLRHENQ